MKAPSLPLWKKLLFTLLLGGFGAALLFAAAELTLHLLGRGASPALVRRESAREAGEGHSPGWRDNRDCTVPVFGPALARRPLPFRLEAKKKAGTVRIFVLGSSAAMGDPEPSFSLSRVLQLHLAQRYPGRRFEVVNAAVTAVNSHVVRGFAEDCARLEPDLFIVLEGNNEVIGPCGPAGVFLPFLSSEMALRTVLALRSTRTGQALVSLSRELRGHGASREEWGGMGMFLKQSIAADDPRLDAVRRLFRANLEAIARSARNAGAGTLLCTVPVNQRDFAPFLSVHREGLAESDLKAWQSFFQAGVEHLAKGGLGEAELCWRKALALDEGHADLNYRLGRLLLEAGRAEQAAPLLGRACDLDALRFRTSSRLNEEIRTLGRSGPPALELVDLAAQLAAKSRHGILGDDFLYEHVHLTLRGTHEAALALLPAIDRTLAQRGLPPPGPALSLDEVRQGLAFTLHEQAMIQQALLKRYEAAPFTGQSDHPLRLASTRRRLAEARRLLATPEAGQALAQVHAAALAASPDDWLLSRNTGAMLLSRGEPAAALPHLQRAQGHIADDIDTLLPLGLCLRALGRDAEAAEVFRAASALEPNYPGLPDYLAGKAAPAGAGN